MTPDVDISAALLIDGWMSTAELLWLAEQARQHERIVEVGSWLGRSAVALADNTEGVVYCVDLWDGNLAPGISGGGWTPETCFAAFLANTAGRRVLRARLPSLVAAEKLSYRLFDMIFLDADHSYEAVKADIQAWRLLLAPGGLLCGHDFSEEFPGVKRAVRELLPGFGLGPGWLWYWREGGEA